MSPRLHQPADGEESADRVRTVAMAVAGTVPLLGSLLTGAIELVWPEMWRRRVETLLQLVDAQLAEIEGWRLEQERVATVAAIAAQQAVVSDDEKIVYLANAVVNTARSDEWEHDVAAVLIRLIGELTATHIRVLRMLAGPAEWIAQHGVLHEQPQRSDRYHLSDTLELAFARAGQPVSDVVLVLQDLQARGLLNADRIGDSDGQQRPHSLDERLASALGRRVLAFVTLDAS